MGDGRALRILVAGATGAVGRSLTTELIARGHRVAGMARRPGGLEHGVVPIAVDALDGEAVDAACKSFVPDVIVHELTAIPASTNMWRFDRDFSNTNRLRTEGTRNLLAAARRYGAQRFVAQSFCGWPYARIADAVKSERDPLDDDPPPQLRSTLQAIRELEAMVCDASDLNGIVLRYGGFYGPRTHFSPGSTLTETIRKRRFPLIGEAGGVWSFLHIQDAASATALAAESATPGIFNVVDDDPAPVAAWLPYLAHVLGAPEPRRIPDWLARLAIPEHIRVLMTQTRGGSNALFRQTFGWRPRFSSWRIGFPAVFGREN